jgi:hypothetical protein
MPPTITYEVIAALIEQSDSKTMNRRDRTFIQPNNGITRMEVLTLR